MVNAKFVEMSGTVKMVKIITALLMEMMMDTIKRSERTSDGLSVGSCDANYGCDGSCDYEDDHHS